MQEHSEDTMMRNLFRFVLLLSLIAISASLALASTPVSCNANFTACSIPENALLQFPPGFLAAAGDVIVQDPNTGKVSDVFRIFNNVLDTGLGTGLGNTGILISADDANTLGIDVSVPSANAVFLKEAASGPTSYVNDGTNYALDTSAVPTSLTYTGDTTARVHRPAQLTAQLTLGGTGVPNQTVQFTLGSQSCSGTTNASGVATCSVVVKQVPPGVYPVTASFGGIFGADAGSSAAIQFLVTP